MSSKTWLLALLGFALFWLPASQATAQKNEAFCNVDLYSEYTTLGVDILPKILGREDLKFFADYEDGWTEIIMLGTVVSEDGYSREYPFSIGVKVDKKTGVVLEHDTLEDWGGVMPKDFTERFGIAPKVSCKVLARK